jgi:hypothetical protein
MTPDKQARKAAARRANRHAKSAAATRFNLLREELDDREVLVDLYKDDRPRTEYQSRSWVSVNDITYTERQSLKPTGWAAIVCASAKMDMSGTGHNKRTPIR